MRSRTRTFYTVALFALLGLMIVLTAGTARAERRDDPDSVIIVVGTGKVKIKPDVARANIGVDVLRPSVREASTESSALLKSILDALHAQNIEREDIQTSGYSIFAERYGPEGVLPDAETQYRVSNTIQVTIRDLDKVGPVLDAAIEAGANNIYGVDFYLDDVTATESEARALALADARRKAIELAGLTEVKLGPVTRISEVIGSSGGFYAGGFAERAQGGFGGGGQTPISPGQVELSMQIEVVYKIAQ